MSGYCIVGKGGVADDGGWGADSPGRDLRGWVEESPNGRESDGGGLGGGGGGGEGGEGKAAKAAALHRPRSVSFADAPGGGDGGGVQGANSPSMAILRRAADDPFRDVAAEAEAAAAAEAEAVAAAEAAAAPADSEKNPAS